MPTSSDYIAPRVVQTPSVCPVLDELPELPVQVLVLTAGGVEDPSRRGLASRLERRSQELGVGGGVVIHDAQFERWERLVDSAEAQRFDVVFLRPSGLPADPCDPDRPADQVLQQLSRLLRDLAVRFWLMDPPTDSSSATAPAAADEPEDARRVALCRALVGRGGPPAVLPPSAWSSEELARFHEDFLERVLHDAPLSSAVGRATSADGPPASLFVPAGRRHGLDLGRLLEDHRRRIDAAGGALAVLHRELEAVPEAAGLSGEALRTALDQDARERDGRLGRVKAACDEINRDRDPAGWSRLSANIQQLSELETDILRVRKQAVSGKAL